MLAIRFALISVLVMVAPALAKERCGDVPLPAFDSLLAPGPHAVAQRTFTFIDSSRPTPANGSYPGAPMRTLVTEVWFPVASPGDTVVDAANGPYPFIIHSHGFSDTRTGMEYLSAHLASRGYMVAAADFPLSNLGAPGGATINDVSNQPGDDSFVIDQLLALSADPTSPLAGGIDPDRIAANGLSLGGMTTLLLTYHKDLRDPRIKASLPMAPGGCAFNGRFYRTVIPFLVMHGTGDHLLPYREYGKRPFKLSHGPRYFVELAQASHVGFTGFGLLFDQTKHLDRVACTIFNDPTVGKLDGSILGPYATKEAGVLLRTPDQRCPAPCTEPFVDPSMAAARQETLTKIVNAAFFDGYMKDDMGARCFVQVGLRDEPDVIVRSR